MSHSDTLLDHVSGISPEFHLELLVLRIVPFVGLLCPRHELSVIGHEIVQRRNFDVRSRGGSFIRGQDGFVILRVTLCWFYEELKGPRESLWRERGTKLDDMDQTIQRCSACTCAMLQANDGLIWEQRGLPEYPVTYASRSKGCASSTTTAHGTSGLLEEGSVCMLYCTISTSSMGSTSMLDICEEGLDSIEMAHERIDDR
jgi:hypothetical protein